MEAVVTAVKNGVRFFLTDEGYGTDIPALAETFDYGCTAQERADKANAETSWKDWNFHWEAVNRLHNGTLVK